jgi:23S rRNA pseudouridine2605 synthase
MGKNTLPAQVSVIARHRHQTRLQVVLTEGRNRQIRRIVQQLGYQVLKLHRSAIGLIQLHPAREAELPPGQYRYLNRRELEFLKNHLNLALEQEAPIYV